MKQHDEFSSTAMKFIEICWMYDTKGNRSKAPDKKSSGQKLPDNKPPTIIEENMRNMPLTLTCPD